MIFAAVCEDPIGVEALGKSLESISKPLQSAYCKEKQSPGVILGTWVFSSHRLTVITPAILSGREGTKSSGSKAEAEVESILGNSCQPILY